MPTVLTDGTYSLCARRFDQEHPGCEAFESKTWASVCSQSSVLVQVASRYARRHGWKCYVFISPSQRSDAPKRAVRIYARDFHAAAAYIAQGLHEVAEEEW